MRKADRLRSIHTAARECQKRPDRAPPGMYAIFGKDRADHRPGWRTSRAETEPIPKAHTKSPYRMPRKRYFIIFAAMLEAIINILVKGFIIGVIVSAPLGPVGVLCIPWTLNKGRWYGFVTGVGASMSDILYALATGYGMSFIADFLSRQIYWLQIIGSVLLLIFGIYTFRSNPVKSIRPVSSSKGTYIHNLVTAFFVTLSNPLIIFLFIALYARFGFVTQDIKVFEQFLGYFSIIIGALTWWFSITYLINKVRKRFDLRGIWIINRTIGGIVVIVSAISFIMTLTGKSLY